MAPKRSGPQAAKSQPRIGSPSASGDGEGRNAYVPLGSQELEDQDVAQMAQKMMDAVHSVALSYLTLPTDSSPDQEKASDSTG